MNPQPFTRHHLQGTHGFLLTGKCWEREDDMHLILANPRGFCAGVNMAIESLEKAIERFGTPLYVYHEIVHNRPIVEKYRDRGVVFVDSIAEVPAGGDGPLQRSWSRS